MNKLNTFKLWLIFFFYAFLISAFVQIVLLPYIFPNLHAGYGLLKSSFDSIGFHQIAVDLAEKIHIHGWSVWQLKPSGQSPAGIGSIFYFFILPDPRILIPFSAALHASAALVLVGLLDLFLKNKTKAILCVLPFLVFPSNFQWTAQWHRDGFSILGIFLILQGIVLSASPELYKQRNWLFINCRLIVFYICGFILIWFARAYILVVIDLFIKLFFSILFLIYLMKAFKGEIPWQKVLFVLFFMLLIIIVLGRLKTNLNPVGFEDSATAPDSKEWEVEEKYETKEMPESPAAAPYIAEKSVDSEGVILTAVNKDNTYQEESKFKEDTVIAIPKDLPLQTISKPLTRKSEVKVNTLIRNDLIKFHWKRSFWLPLFFEKKAYSLALAREGFRLSGPQAKSNIDSNISFGNVKGILAYLPRAAQIVFLAPFPNQWLQEGSHPGNTLMRRMAAYEMIAVYLILLFLPYALWHWRKRIEIWIIFLFCTYIMLMHGLVVCNVGSLYRMRYPYIMTLVSLGIAGFIVFLNDIRSKKISKV
ncbi:MAG: hypothetical protein PHR84_05225 [Candidatus Omnitrophica bacterium]|nr:hypothetical protein [Candidatus Omnitrophota bacterium]MDD5660353.1 hypothetical protein [Candidatus Omnitrophota bacterium]